MENKTTPKQSNYFTLQPETEAYKIKTTKIEEIPQDSLSTEQQTKRKHYRQKFSRSFTFQSSSSSSNSSNESQHNLFHQSQLKKKETFFEIQKQYKNIERLRQRKSACDKQMFSSCTFIPIKENQENIDASNLLFEEDKLRANYSDYQPTSQNRLVSGILEETKRSNQLKYSHSAQKMFDNAHQNGGSKSVEQKLKGNKQISTKPSLNSQLLSSQLYNIQIKDKVQDNYQTQYKHYFSKDSLLRTSDIVKSPTAKQQEICQEPSSCAESNISVQDLEERVNREDVDLKILCNSMFGCFVNTLMFGLRRRPRLAQPSISPPYQQIGSSSQFDVLQSKVKDEEARLKSTRTPKPTKVYIQKQFQ